MNSDGYLLSDGQERIHRVLRLSKLQDDFDAFVKEGFKGCIDDLNAVAHLDDDQWNCNIDNLLNMPEAWNYNLKKAKIPTRNGKKWKSSVTIAKCKAYHTKSVSDPDEALVQYDILKVKHFVKHVV